MSLARTPIILAVLLLLLAPAAAQPVETVVVDDDSPVGVWKFTMPQSSNTPPFGKAVWGPTGNEFCEIEKIRGKLTAHCPGVHLGGEDVSWGTATVDGNHLRMAWGSMWFFIAINGALRAGQFQGTFSVQTLGIPHDAPDKVIGRRLALSTNMPDKAGKSGLLAHSLDEMARGVFTAPSDTKATNIRILKLETLHELGDVQSILYIGDKGFLPAGDSTNVYDVEFANGHLICELRQAADDRLDYFDCG